MRKLFAYCAFCDKGLRKKASISDKTGYILCTNCSKTLTRELGPGWEHTDWWKEFELSYNREENQRRRFYDNDLSLETLAERVESGKARSREIAGLDGKPITNIQHTVDNVIKRLYTSYGWGSQNIERTLQHAYKLQISRRYIDYRLKDMKEFVKPNNESSFWKDWHMTLARLEKEYRIK